MQLRQNLLNDHRVHCRVEPILIAVTVTNQLVEVHETRRLVSDSVPEFRSVVPKNFEQRQHLLRVIPLSIFGYRDGLVGGCINECLAEGTAASVKLDEFGGRWTA